MRNYQSKSNAGGVADSINAERFGAGEFNSIAVELENAVDSSDQTLAPADGTGEVSNQLAMAMAIYGAGGGQYVEDTGAANAYVVDPVSPKEAAPAYFDGLTLSFKPGNANTTAATVNYNSLGVKSITDLDGNALTGGEITGAVTIRYNLTDDRFEIVKPAMVTLDAISGLATQNGTDTDHDIDIQVGEAMDSTNGYLLRLTSILTKQIDASWAAGSNAGGLFTGTVAATSTYYVFLIRKDSDGSIDAGFDTSISASNIPAGYTAYRLIDVLLTDASANIRQWDATTNGREIRKRYFETISDLNGATPVNTRTLLTLTVPTGLRVYAHIECNCVRVANDTNVWLKETQDNDVVPFAKDTTLSVEATSTLATAVIDLNTNTSGQIAYRSNQAVTLRINTVGYVFTR